MVGPSLSVLAVVLASVGTVAGLAYSILGILALKHLPDADETDRVAGWTLWWWLDGERYDPEGQRLCKLGGWVLGVGAVCWLIAFVLWRR